MVNREHFDIVIIGGGIAGASLAYFLASRGHGDLLILEREEQPGYHATGRSASVAEEVDSIPTTRLLKVLGTRFLREPPAGFADSPLLDETGILMLYAGEEWREIERLAPIMERDGTKVELLSNAEVMAEFPVLAAQHFDGGLHLPEDGRIDVHALLSAYLRHAARGGAVLRARAEVTGIMVERGRCAGVVTRAGEIGARCVVNAAGAWAGRVAELAGATPIAITPKKRTVITFAPPPDLEVARWPLVANETHHLYFAPESGGLLASPMDQTPTEPCDARPDEITIAETIEKIERMAPPLRPRSLRHKWAGLRTFAPDDGFVVGEDPILPGFFWLAGQGGAGIVTSPAIGAIAADLLIDGSTDRLDASLLSPSRFRDA